MRIQGAQRIVRPSHGATFLRAGALSCVLHGAALGLLLALPWSWRLASGPRLHFALGDSAATHAEAGEPTWVELASAQTVVLEQPIPPLGGEDHSSLDRGAAVGSSSAPRVAVPTEDRLPAADQGQGPGRRLAPAFRRDTSTLRARLSDGATVYRPARERTGASAASPQALRQESHPGLGDSSRTRRARAFEQPARPAPEPEGDGDFALLAAAPERAAGADPVRSLGKLDAEPGRRSFDVEPRGRASDSVWSRAASDETRPGPMDLSQPSSPGPLDGRAGRGSGHAPGAAAHALTGSAPAPAGRNALRPGEDSDGAAGGAQSRYLLEIRRRVDGALRFPHELALRLQQGETVVAFTVAPDGKLAGPIQVVKSAGFADFDSEAIAAVRRAAPFPATGKPVPITMRVTFRNPTVR